MIIENVQLEDYPKLAADILKQHPSQKLILLHGEMGAGKTTFTKSILRYLGVSDPGASPTFGLVNEYHDSEGNPCYHFDCYRLKTEDELLAAGWYEYVESGAYCMVEWPEKIEGILPDDFLLIQISLQSNGRKFEVKSFEA